MALLNDLRAQNKMAKLGFANPFIYQTAAADPTAFNDCTEGSNKGCGLSTGFRAFAKWDPASGYGSPNYAVLSKKSIGSWTSNCKTCAKKKRFRRSNKGCGLSTGFRAF